MKPSGRYKIQRGKVSTFKLTLEAEEKFELLVENRFKTGGNHIRADIVSLAIIDLYKKEIGDAKN